MAHSDVLTTHTEPATLENMSNRQTGTNTMATATRRIGPVTINAVTRRNNSTNGNPTYVLHTSEGDYRTQADAALGYSVQNLTNSRFPESYAIGDGAPPVTLLATQSGRVFGIELNGRVL